MKKHPKSWSGGVRGPTWPHFGAQGGPRADKYGTKWFVGPPPLAGTPFSTLFGAAGKKTKKKELQESSLKKVPIQEGPNPQI